jgi:hypothetical protein
MGRADVEINPKCEALMDYRMLMPLVKSASGHAISSRIILSSIIKTISANDFHLHTTSFTVYYH